MYGQLKDFKEWRNRDIGVIDNSYLQEAKILYVGSEG